MDNLEGIVSFVEPIISEETDIVFEGVNRDLLAIEVHLDPS